MLTTLVERVDADDTRVEVADGRLDQRQVRREGYRVERAARPDLDRLNHDHPLGVRPLLVEALPDGVRQPVLGRENDARRRRPPERLVGPRRPRGQARMQVRHQEALAEARVAGEDDQLARGHPAPPEPLHGRCHDLGRAGEDQAAGARPSRGRRLPRLGTEKGVDVANRPVETMRMLTLEPEGVVRVVPHEHHRLRHARVARVLLHPEATDRVPAPTQVGAIPPARAHRRQHVDLIPPWRRRRGRAVVGATRRRGLRGQGLQHLARHEHHHRRRLDDRGPVGPLGGGVALHRHRPVELPDAGRVVHRLVDPHHVVAEAGADRRESGGEQRGDGLVVSQVHAPEPVPAVATHAAERVGEAERLQPRDGLIAPGERGLALRVGCGDAGRADRIEVGQEPSPPENVPIGRRLACVRD
jgi:hypothetical protein